MTPTPDQIAELKSKVGALALKIVVGKYANANGKLDKGELVNLLSDAGVGNFITRGAWAEGIIKALDKNADSQVSVDEFMGVLKGETIHGAPFTIYSYLFVVESGNAKRVTGPEPAIKALWVKGANRLYRVCASLAYHSTEEFDGTGWVEVPTLSL